MNKLKLFILGSVLYIILQSQNSYAGAARFALSFGGIDWKTEIVAMSYDQLNLLPRRNATLGGEITLLNGGFILTPRVLFWQKKSLSGFYGGPSASIGVIKDGHISHSYNNNYNNFLVGIGAEGGWLYRFLNRVEIGGATEVTFSSYGVWLGFKASVGVLVP